jgi:hypothetical protein
MPASAVLQHLVLRKAVSVCGGDEETLSRILNVSIVELRGWMDGKGFAPLPVFNEAMRLVNDAYRKARSIDGSGDSPGCPEI